MKFVFNYTRVTHRAESIVAGICGTRTKQMVITTKQMFKVHNLDGYTPPLTLKDKTVDRVQKFNLLETWFSEDLKLTEHVNEVTSSCYQALATLRKIKNRLRSLLFKASCSVVVLSKLNFTDSVTYPLPAFLHAEKSTKRSECCCWLCLESLLLRKGRPSAWQLVTYTKKYAIKHS